MLFEVSRLLNEFGVNIVSVATAPHDDPASKVLVLRIETDRYKLVKAAIKKAGYEILSAD